MNNIIAFAGLRNSGKDTASDMLYFCLNMPKCLRHYWFYKKVKPFRHRWQKIAFAKPLKQMLAELIGVSVRQFDNREFKENYVVHLPTLEVRPATQDGLFKPLTDNQFSRMLRNSETEISECTITIRQLMQYFGTTIGLKYLGKSVWVNATIRNIFGNTIITDLRFRHEADAVHAAGGKIYYIDRPDCEPGNHVSEREVIKMFNDDVYDGWIHNNGGFKELFNTVKTIAKRA